MKILHYSDKASTELPNLYQECDMLFATGDLTIFDFFNLSEKVMFGVYGNHCSGKYFDEIGIINSHLTIYEWRGFRIGGFEGCVRYKEAGGPQYTQDEARQMLADFPRVDILLLHAPPAGLLDDPKDPVHVGFQATRDYIDRHKPKYVFCGHLYENAEMEYNGTKIYRTYGARIIEID